MIYDLFLSIGKSLSSACSVVKVQVFGIYVVCI